MRFSKAFELARDKFKLAKRMKFDEKSIEIATPEILANYRAERLSCECIIDIGCGIGGDTIALAATCGKVIAIDIDQKMIDFARNNCKAYGRKNVIFVRGDALKMNLKKYGATYAFADPTRRLKERRIKELSETIPSTIDLIKKLSFFRGFCIEVSQQLNVDEIPFDCEKEYVSLNGELRCLSLYFGELKRCERSAVVLPQKERIESKESTEKAKESSELKKFFYEIDPAVVKANLVDELASNFDLFIFKNFLTSDERVDSPFFKNSFEFLTITDEDNLIDTLNEFDAGKVVIRGRIEPNKQLELKRNIEANLYGSKKLHVFLGREMIIARSLKINQ